MLTKDKKLVWFVENVLLDETTIQFNQVVSVKANEKSRRLRSLIR